jgi:hypothetical protein
VALPAEVLLNVNTPADLALASSRIGAAPPTLVGGDRRS